MGSGEIIWLINGELDRAQDEHIRDILTDMKASCNVPSNTVDLGYLLNRYGEIFEFPLNFLKNMVLISKNTNKLVEDASSYITEHSKDTQYHSNLIRLLSIFVIFFSKTDGEKFMLEYKLVSHILISALASEETKTIAYETLISYNKLLTDTEKVDCLNTIYKFCCEHNNLDIFCALLNHIPTDLFYTDNVCFTKIYFWEHIESCVSGSEPHLKKQGEYILSKYVEHFSQAKNTLFACEDFKKTWQAFFMLLDIGKEKQLHLVSPALKQLKYIFNLPFLWQKCIFKMYLNHSQSSIVYQVATEVLKGKFVAGQLQEIIHLVFVAINKNEYNKLSCETFEQLKEFCSKLDTIELKIVVEEILKISWNAESFFQVLRSVLTQKNADKVFIEDILKCASQLPHVYIRSECLKYLLEISWDGNDFNQLAKMVSICKIDPENHTHVPNLSYNESKLVKSIISNVVKGKNVRLGLAILKHLRRNVWNFFCDLLKSMDPNAALCIWSDWFMSNKDRILSSDNIKDQNAISDFFFKYFKTSLCEEFFDLYLEFIHVFPICSNKTLDIGQEMIFKPLWSPSNYTVLQQAVALALTRTYDDIYVSFSCPLGIPVASIKNGAGSLTDVYAKQAIMARTFAVIIFDQIKTEKIQADLAEEMLLLLLDFQTKNKDLLEIYKSVRCIPSKYTGLIDCLYAHLIKLKKDQYFRKILIAFISILYTSKNSTQNFDFIINDLLKYAEINPYIRFKFIEFIPRNSLVLHLSVLVDLYLQGLLVTKDEKTEYNFCQFFARSDLSGRELDFSNPNLIAASARLLAIKKLLDLSQKECHMVVNLLIERYMKHFKKRYFPDSKVHYEKLRIVQMILMLFSRPDHNTNNELCKTLKSFTYRCLYEETNQTCVRQLMSWILMVAASNNPSEVLDRMQSAEVPVSALINLIPVIYNLVQQSDEQILERVISMALPWTMGPQFRLRVYAQELIRKILEDFCKKHPNFYNKYEHLKTCIENSIKSTPDAYKNALKTDVVFFTAFNPMESIPKEIILVEIPKLNKVHPSEWECLKIIFDIVESPKEDEILTVMFSLEVDEFLEKCNSSFTDDIKLSAESYNEMHHIQKKITPWKSTLDNINSQTNSDFILVASLISKPQNLGGLSRTCEVFGIRDVTFNDAKVTNDKEFKSLSMSSEGWINAIEVKSTTLREYLASLRDDGFCVIGAEQTAGSEQLNKFHFPRKVALVLGNEKTGIPPDIIPLLDKCLEIPQFGQTRSLNVHVAGATFIWEYAKQHLVG